MTSSVHLRCFVRILSLRNHNIGRNTIIKKADEVVTSVYNTIYSAAIDFRLAHH